MLGHLFKLKEFILNKIVFKIYILLLKIKIFIYCI